MRPRRNKLVLAQEIQPIVIFGALVRAGRIAAFVGFLKSRSSEHEDGNFLNKNGQNITIAAVVNFPEGFEENKKYPAVVTVT